MSVATLPEKEIRWTPKLIKRLREERTQAEFAELLGAAVEDVELWESGQAAPDAEQTKHLSKLAEKERFLRDWKLAGSGVLRTDLKEALRGRWNPDEFFSANQQKRLGELMARLRTARDAGQMLATEERKELEDLVEAELTASAKRAEHLKGERCIR